MLIDYFKSFLGEYIKQYTEPRFLSWVALNLIKSVLVLLVSWIIVKVSYKVIDRILSPEADTKWGIKSDIVKMMGTVLKTLIFYGAYFTAVLFTLHFFGLNIVAKLNLVQIAGSALKVIGIIIGSRMTIRIGRIIIDQVFAKSTSGTFFGEEKRIKTLKALTKSILAYGVYFIGGLMILGAVGVETTSIIASAGILGLAVGFGAQNLVKDVITGFFIIFENYFSVGEYIHTAGVSGNVEEMGLRTTIIRDWSGEVHIVPNGEITMVTNHSRGKMRAQVEIGIAYEEDIDEAIKVLHEAAEKVKEVYADEIIEGPDVLGVQALGASDVVIRIVAYTEPMQQWAVERALRKELKQALDNAGIEIPYPRRVIIHNRDDGGLDGE